MAQETQLDAPATVEIFPAAQLVQIVEAEAAAYFPWPHIVQVEAPALAYCPEEHLMQLVDASSSL